MYRSDIYSLRSIMSNAFGFKYITTKVQRQPCRDSTTTYILMKKLFSPSFGSTHALFKIGSAHEMRIRSGVAGLCKCSTPVSPNSFLAAFSASRMAKKTALPMNSGGSPG